MTTWLREWWVTFRYGSPFTKAGRRLRRNLRDDMTAYVDTTPPGADIDCVVAGCRWGGCWNTECECLPRP